MVTSQSRALVSLLPRPQTKRQPYIHVGVVLCIVLAILLPRHSHADNGELQLRDEFNDKSYHEAVPKAPPVTNRAEAEEYLQHFGYLNCSISTPSRKKRQLELHNISEGESDINQDGADPCSEEDYTVALKSFQTAMKLRATGILDEATKNVMMKGRCGNSDNLIAEETLEVLAEKEDLERGKPEMAKLDRGWRNSKDGPIKSRRRRNASHQSSQTRVLDSMWRWFANRLYSYTPSDSSIVNTGKQLEEKTAAGFFHMMPILCADDFYRNSLKSAHCVELMHTVEEGPEDAYDSDDSLLTQLLTPHERRRKKRNVRMEMLEEMQQTIRSRKRRDLQQGEKPVFFNESTDNYNYQWNSKSLLYYKVDMYSNRIARDIQCTIITLAFRMWAEVTNLDFAHAPEGMLNADVDIFIGFGLEKHFGCAVDFDGEGGVLAHSNKIDGHSNIHIDQSENFKKNPSSKGAGIPLLVIFVHEIGHALGLAHHNMIQSVMFPVLGTSFYQNFELTLYDRKSIQGIYGTCTGRFNAMFDWLHTKTNGCAEPCKCLRRRWQYYSFFFRDNQYWLYLNSKGRPRYGDPKLISLLWKGIPDKVDAVVQTTRTVTCTNFNSPVKQLEIQTLFFKDDKYYEYNDINDEVKENGTKLISDRFGPKPGSTMSVPNNLDAVLFDPRDDHLYFFKDEWIWEVDPYLDPENGTCCVGEKRRFSDYFIFNETLADTSALNDTEIPSLVGNIDSIYLRWQKQTIYIFKGKFVWYASIRKNNTAFFPPGPLNLTFDGFWNKKWNYICSVNAYGSSHHCDI